MDVYTIGFQKWNYLHIQYTLSSLLNFNESDLLFPAILFPFSTLLSTMLQIPDEYLFSFSDIPIGKR